MSLADVAEEVFLLRCFVPLEKHGMYQFKNEPVIR